AATVQSKRHRSETGTVGGPTQAAEIKSRDVPDMKYLHTDNPFPRGEIAIRGPPVAMAYYKLPELTRAAFADHGRFETGGIGMWDENGMLRIIDRRKNLIKLAHGEYVALEALESLYGNSPFISPNGICVYGDPEKNHLVAMILPQETYVISWAKKNGIKGDFP